MTAFNTLPTDTAFCLVGHAMERERPVEIRDTFKSRREVYRQELEAEIADLQLVERRYQALFDVCDQSLTEAHENLREAEGLLMGTQQQLSAKRKRLEQLTESIGESDV